jgi:hypothetical protein
MIGHGSNFFLEKELLVQIILQSVRQRIALVAALMLLLISGSALASAQTQPTYWLGHSTGTAYLFDTPLPADFAAMLTASDPKYAVGKQLPEFSTQVIDGESYSFVTTEVSWDKDAIDSGSISYVRNGMLGAAWFTMDAKSAEWPAVAQAVKDQAVVATANGAWKRAKLFVLIAPDATKPTVRVPIPPLTLAKTKMSELGKQTTAGQYYPSVKVPADLAAFREQMLVYGNTGRRDPNFRKGTEAKTATDLSGATVRTLGGTDTALLCRPCAERTTERGGAAPGGIYCVDQQAQP